MSVAGLALAVCGFCSSTSHLLDRPDLMSAAVSACCCGTTLCCVVHPVFFAFFQSSTTPHPSVSTELNHLCCLPYTLSYRISSGTYHCASGDFLPQALTRFVITNCSAGVAQLHRARPSTTTAADQNTPHISTHPPFLCLMLLTVLHQKLLSSPHYLSNSHYILFHPPPIHY